MASNKKLHFVHWKTLHEISQEELLVLHTWLLRNNKLSLYYPPDLPTSPSLRDTDSVFRSNSGTIITLCSGSNPVSERSANSLQNTSSLDSNARESAAIAKFMGHFMHKFLFVLVSLQNYLVSVGSIDVLLEIVSTGTTVNAGAAANSSGLGSSQLHRISSNVSRASNTSFNVPSAQSRQLNVIAHQSSQLRDITNSHPVDLDLMDDLELLLKRLSFKFYEFQAVIASHLRDLSEKGKPELENTLLDRVFQVNRSMLYISNLLNSIDKLFNPPQMGIISYVALPHDKSNEQSAGKKSTGEIERIKNNFVSAALLYETERKVRDLESHLNIESLSLTGRSLGQISRKGSAFGSLARMRRNTSDVRCHLDADIGPLDNERRKNSIMIQPRVQSCSGLPGIEIGPAGNRPPAALRNPLHWEKAAPQHSSLSKIPSHQLLSSLSFESSRTSDYSDSESNDCLSRKPSGGSAAFSMNSDFGSDNGPMQGLRTRFSTDTDDGSINRSDKCSLTSEMTIDGKFPIPYQRLRGKRDYFIANHRLSRDPERASILPEISAEQLQKSHFQYCVRIYMISSLASRINVTQDTPVLIIVDQNVFLSEIISELVFKYPRLKGVGVSMNFYNYYKQVYPSALLKDCVQNNTLFAFSAEEADCELQRRLISCFIPYALRPVLSQHILKELRVIEKTFWVYLKNIQAEKKLISMGKTQTGSSSGTNASSNAVSNLTLIGLRIDSATKELMQVQNKINYNMRRAKTLFFKGWVSVKREDFASKRKDYFAVVQNPGVFELYQNEVSVSTNTNYADMAGKDAIFGLGGSDDLFEEKRLSRKDTKSPGKASSKKGGSGLPVFRTDITGAKAQMSTDGTRLLITSTKGILLSMKPVKTKVFQEFIEAIYVYINFTKVDFSTYPLPPLESSPSDK